MNEKIEQMIEKLKAQVEPYVKELKIRAFGVNNERLDLLMDSFNRLTPSQKTGVFVGGGAAIVVFVLLELALYFSGISSLKTELEQSFAAIHELEAEKHEYKRQEARFNKLADTVGQRGANVAKKPLFEKIGNDLGISLEGLNESKVPMSTDNPLSKRLQESKVDLRASNISIPRLLNFLSEVEKSNNFLRVRDLQIRSRYGTRLYFDSTVSVRGYSSASN